MLYRRAALALTVLLMMGCVAAPPAPTPAEVREQERNERTVKAACAQWWDGLRELTDEAAEVCTVTGWGK